MTDVCVALTSGYNYNTTKINSILSKKLFRKGIELVYSNETILEQNFIF